MCARYTRRKRSRNSKNFVALPFGATLSLGTLADQAVVSTSLLGGNLTEDLYAISMDVLADIGGLTAGEGEPALLGVAHGDYANTEIAEALNVILLGPGNKIEQERARRLVRKVGTFHGNDLNTQVQMKMIGRDGSRLVRIKLKFMVQSGQDLSIFVQNLSQGTLTTGAVLKFSGTAYGRWII